MVQIQFKKIQIAKGINGKLVDGILICGKEFEYSDKRGWSRHAMVTIEFAHQIMHSFEAQTINEQHMPNVGSDSKCKLSWDRYSDGTYELRLHYRNGHMWTSKPITI